MLDKVFADGWYVMVKRGDKWYAVANLRFARQHDAKLAAKALTLEGLDSYSGGLGGKDNL